MCLSVILPGVNSLSDAKRCTSDISRTLQIVSNFGVDSVLPPLSYEPIATAVIAPAEWAANSARLHPRDMRAARILDRISFISIVSMECRVESMTRSGSGISTEQRSLVVFFRRIL
jgi:hypothetical protein